MKTSKTPEYQLDLLQDRRDGLDRRDSGRSGPERRVKTRDSGVIDLHNGNLWDQNEDEAGETTDMATGKKFDNSTFTDETHVLKVGGYIVDTMIEVDPYSVGMSDGLDEADIWLAEHGGVVDLPELGQSELASSPEEHTKAS